MEIGLINRLHTQQIEKESEEDEIGSIASDASDAGDDSDGSEDSEDSEASEDEGEVEGETLNINRDDETSSEDSNESGDDEQINTTDIKDSGADDSQLGNSGWADAMAKVLNMGKNSDKPVSVLSKAKKDNAVVKKVEPSQKLDGDSSSSDGETTEEVPHVPVSVRRAKKREIDSVCRVKPDITGDRSREKVLVKIATRGVVQLFNAVREQQKNVKEKLKQAGNSRARENILKNINKDEFLNVLDGKKRTSNTAPLKKRPKLELKSEDEDEVPDDPSWSALKKDFMLGAKMKDWDKLSDDE